MSNIDRTYLIIGAGHQGMAMAAHFSLFGEKVNIWNRTKANIERIIENKLIICNGVVNGTAYIQKASSDLGELIADTIFVTTPSTAYKNIAKQLARLILPNTVIYLNPGRTFGAIEFMEVLEENGCRELPTIVETQSIVYTCRKFSQNETYIYALKDNVEMASIEKAVKREEVINRLPECIKERFTFVDSVLHTSLGNIGMILHCAPVLMNIGWIESTKHDFHYYYDGISPSIGAFLEKMDKERIKVASMMGVKTKSLIEWFEDCYGVRGNSIYDCIQKNMYYRKIDAPKTIEHRYLDEDIPNGLVPIECLGKEFGLDVKNISIIIDLAEALRGINYRELGRRYSVRKINEILNCDIKY